MTETLLPCFADAIRDISDAAALNPQNLSSLLLHREEINGRAVEMIYAPFDYVNAEARIAIVGLTPGRQQTTNALLTARAGLRQGASLAAAAKEAKAHASFSGPMRSNLVRLLDHIGIARFLGMTSTAELWQSRMEMAHFTSALRYPVFVDGQNWSGQPDMVRVASMRKWLESYTGLELSTMRQALLVPLGPKVTAALQHLAALGLIDAKHILSGLPHPSGANAERISCFLGEKPAHLASEKTNAGDLLRARDRLKEQIANMR